MHTGHLSNLNCQMNRIQSFGRGLLLVEESVSKIKEKGKDSDDSGSSCSEWYLKHLQLLTVHCPVPINPTVLSRWIAAVRNFSTLLSDSCPADDFRRTVECLFNIAITKNDLPS